MSARSRNVMMRGRIQSQMNRALVRSLALLTLVFIVGGMDSASCGSNNNTNGNNNNNSNTNTGPKPDIDEARDHILVKDGATPAITVVEYGDLQCPACGSFARNNLDRLLTDYVDTGKVRYVFRHYPLNGHAQAVPSAEASECIANQDESQFFDFIEQVYANQSTIYANGGNQTDAELRDLADSMGFDLDAYDACLAGNSEIIRVEEDRTSGDALGIAVTPTFFVEDVHIGEPGPLQNTIDKLFETIDRLLAE